MNSQNVERDSKDMLIYSGIGNEINCPNCGTEIKYDPNHNWVFSGDTIRITDGYCPNEKCPVYDPLGTVPGYESAVRFRTWRHATENEIDGIKKGWGKDLSFNSYERCPKHNLELSYVGDEVDGVKIVLAACPGCDYKIHVPLEEAREITKRRVIRIDSVKEK